MLANTKGVQAVERQVTIEVKLDLQADNGTHTEHQPPQLIVYELRCFKMILI